MAGQGSGGPAIAAARYNALSRAYTHRPQRTARRVKTKEKASVNHADALKSENTMNAEWKMQINDARELTLSRFREDLEGLNQQIASLRAICVDCPSSRNFSSHLTINGT
jgi:hypothetical protein